jgi:hypothetical protein
MEFRSGSPTSGGNTSSIAGSTWLPSLKTVLDAVRDPEYILRGYKGTLIAVVHLGERSYLNVVYRELSQRDGFIITARIEPQLNKSKIIWRRDS